MVAIKQASLLSTLPLLLAVSSQALASQESGDLVSRDEGAVYERAYDEGLYERDFDDELYERDFDDELDERDFDDELDERDFDEELDERDFDDELDERDFDDELYERDEDDLFERDDYDLYLEPRGGILSKPKKEKPKISKPTLQGGTNPVAMKDKDLKSSKNRHSSTSMEVPIKLVTSRPRSLYARGGILSKPKKVEKAKIGKPTLQGGTNPVAMKDKDLKSSKNRHSSTSMEVPIKLVTSRPRSLYARGGILSKPKKVEKAKIGKPTLQGGTNPVAMKDKDLKSSKNRHSSTSMEVPIKLVTSRPRSLWARGGVLSKPKKSSKNRHSSGSMEVPIKLVTSRPRAVLQRRGGVLSKPKKVEKAKIGKPTLQGGTNPVAMKDKDLKSSNRHSATSMEVPIKLVKSRH
ncbi:unnamed protein product [Clonostachys rosea f. rosea IK726]|uniref:Uncharacterized protein n=1 Tax=Clonostachys rosea f. rosea IK726 TaxID=1349383 RepID=A0ACA9UT61_BIOOC|nr:unnamed protein product [Clonostachys rosea f. rosea IK726]